MKALILNSGMGSRMGKLTSDKPKCMTVIGGCETILSRQLRLLYSANIEEVVITTGFLSEILEDYCQSLGLDLKYTFVRNARYDQTNYIYSIYLARQHLQDEIIMLHGDLVFETGILNELLDTKGSRMTISTLIPLPPKDFKAVLSGGLVHMVGVEFFENAYAAQPLYKLSQEDWITWLEKIVEYCEKGQVNCYAENALNEVTESCRIYPFDFGQRLCTEIDNWEDLQYVQKRLNSNMGGSTKNGR